MYLVSDVRSEVVTKMFTVVDSVGFSVVPLTGLASTILPPPLQQNFLSSG